MDWNQIARYLAGELPPAEAARVREWLEANPSDAETVRALDAATRGVVPARAIDVEGALRAVKARRAAAGATAAAPRAGARVAIRMIAAAVLLVAAGLYASWSHRGGLELQSFATGVGETDTVSIGKASTAILGPGSSLEMRGRDIALIGDAFFSIGERGSGYVVRAGDVTVRDIGTEFGVSASGETGVVRVVVKSGIVEIERGRTKITADSGDVAEVGAAIGLRSDAFSDDEIGYAQGRLVLRDASMREVARELRRWHGVELRVDSALAGRHFTGAFGSESARQVVDVIALAIGATVAQSGDTLTLSAARK
ncbi:MAG TPA: FecR domain-containing protein [Gemmatimonadaceae bacterium]|nr:FecR domain-containing protein [Gemmatimonadaceae bacterium]